MSSETRHSAKSNRTLESRCNKQYLLTQIVLLKRVDLTYGPYLVWQFYQKRLFRSTLDQKHNAKFLYRLTEVHFNT